ANAIRFPNLSKMAQDYLAIPAISAPIGRVFAGETDLVIPKR
ncbi:30074_t:CDS:2, partial [Racocetra persica]